MWCWRGCLGIWRNEPPRRATDFVTDVTDDLSVGFTDQLSATSALNTVAKDAKGREGERFGVWRKKAKKGNELEE